jgi:hypothetical protein
VALTKTPTVASRGVLCFGCNQGFEGNPIAYRYDTDLLNASQQAELAGLVFHEGHLQHYARRRGWNALDDELAKRGGHRY